MIVPDEEMLKLGKGAAFSKSRIKTLPPSAEVWEADFPALPRPIEQSGTPDLGMVVTEGNGSLLADTTVPGRPSVNDLATVLAHAMRRPLDEHARRPRLVRLRGHQPGMSGVMERSRSARMRESDSSSGRSALAGPPSRTIGPRR